MFVCTSARERAPRKTAGIHTNRKTRGSVDETLNSSYGLSPYLAPEHPPSICSHFTLARRRRMPSPMSISRCATPFGTAVLRQWFCCYSREQKKTKSISFAVNRRRRVLSTHFIFYVLIPVDVNASRYDTICTARPDRMFATAKPPTCFCGVGAHR